MRPGEAYQILSDCPHCRVEASVVEIVDPVHPASHLGVATEVRCRLCAWTVVAVDEPFPARHPLALGRCPACNTTLDEASRSGRGPCAGCGYRPRTRVLRDAENVTLRDEALAALARWAAEEGEADVERFCTANMGIGADEVVARLSRREPVATSFDVVAYLFPAAGVGRAPDPRLVGAVEVVDHRPPPPVLQPLPSVAPATVDPRLPARLLASVMLADGELRDGERRFVDGFLDASGLAPLAPDDLRVWRPHELGPPPAPETRDRLLEACVHLMHLDRQRDGSEWKVATAFAAAWGVPASQLEAWDRAYDARYGTTLTRLWNALSGLVRTG